MKKNIYLYLFLSLSLFFATCTGMDETYKEFLDDSDVLYTGRVDSVEVSTGIGRLKFDFIVSHDPKVKKLIIYWDSRQKNVEYEITPSDIGERKEFEVTGLAEGFHTFEFICYDMNGSPSVSKEIIGQVYGDKFKARVNNRNITAAMHSGTNEVTIEWSAINSSFADVNVDLHYTNINGDAIVLKIPSTTTETLITDYKEGKAFQVQSFIKPDSSCLDIYSTELANSATGIISRVYYDDKKLSTPWKVLGVSSDRPHTPASRVIDGDSDDKHWHSDGNTARYPHWLILDLGEELDITGFYMVQRWPYGEQQAKNVTVFANETGLDVDGWNEVRPFVLPRVSKKTQEHIPLSSLLNTRYVKFIFHDAHVASKTVMNLMELGAYADVEWK